MNFGHVSAVNMLFYFLNKVDWRVSHFLGILFPLAFRGPLKFNRRKATSISLYYAM